ncbi:MAG: class I SAM-dependent RNA methyltransferase, partial [Anaerolineales bacterium]
MGEDLVIQLADMAHGGDAVGRHEGKAIFVPYGIPGESVRVEILRDRGRFAHARLLEVLSASPQRVQPPCPYFGVCGGCQWQHLSYDSQLEYKRSIVHAQLQRIAGIRNPVVQPTLGMSDPWGYRNHVQFAVTRDGNLGFMAASSHNVVPIDRCLVMHPLLQEAFDSLDIELPDLRRLSLRAGINTGDQMVIFELGSDQPPELELDVSISCVLLLSDGASIALVGSPYLHERALGRSYRISPSSFFQVNTGQAEKLISLVRDYLIPKADSVVVDAYCGVGTFGLALAGQAKQVIGIESSASAITDARANSAGVDNFVLIEGRAEEVLPTLSVAAPLVILDPPRTGLGKDALSAIVNLAPTRIV